MIKMSFAERVFLRMASVSFAVLVVVLLALTIFRLRKSNGKGGNRGRTEPATPIQSGKR
jgi:hypothetical protein